MINGPKTNREVELENRMKESNFTWKVTVINSEDGDVIMTHYSSEIDSLDNVLHKIKLDLMTNLEYGLVNPIQVIIKQTNTSEISLKKYLDELYDSMYGRNKICKEVIEK